MTLDERLFEAVKTNNPDEVETLLSQKANIATKDKDGATVLHLAALKGQEDVVEVLMRADESKEIVNIKDTLDRTALHNCCMRGHTKAVKLLLKNGADVTATDQEGWTALHHAADEGYLEVVRCLVEHVKECEMNFDQKTIQPGGTALHIAAERGFAGIVDELMRNGASSTTKSRDGETVLHWALEGAIMRGNGLDRKDEVGDEVHGNYHIDEALNFDDDDYSEDYGTDQRIERFRLEDTADQWDVVFERILRGMDGATKWSELLKVARRRERLETLQYLMSKMYPQQRMKALQRPLKRIWLAMSEARTQELMEMLWAEAREARTPELVERVQKEASGITGSMGKWDNIKHWDVLSLATSLGKVQTVYWLLRCRPWSKSDIDKARNLPRHDRLNRNETLSTENGIWNTPFIHDGRSGEESYRWPTDGLEDEPNLDRFGASIMDFHRVDNHIVSIYHDCGPWSLMDKDRGPERTMKRSMESLGNQNIAGVVTNEYSDASRYYRWIHLAINSVSQIHR